MCVVRQTVRAGTPSIDRSRCLCRVHGNPGREFATSLFTFPFGAVAVRAEPFINTPLIDAPRWSTSSFSDSAHTTPQELSALGEHLDTCKGSHGRLFAVRCAAEMLDGFVSARIVTTLVVAALLIGVSSLVL